MDHLYPEFAPLLNLPDPERIKFIEEPRWIGYPRADEIFQTLDDLFYHPKISRMPNALLCGPSGAGKSFIIERFAKQKNRHESERPQLPVFLVQSRPTPDERDFYSECLTRLCVPHRASERAAELGKQLRNVLHNLHTRLIAIEEVHNMLSGSGLKQRAFLNVLKTLTNELKIPIVAVGTRAALLAFRVEPEIANRFQPLPLPRWQDDEFFRKLLSSFEATMPLRKPSYLEDDLPGHILIQTEGLIGEVSDYLRKAAKLAIHTGRECIDRDLLNGMGWILPSLRSDKALELTK